MDRENKNNGAGSWEVLLVFCFALISTQAFAVDVEVDGATSTTLDAAPNGVPIVNIANPNIRGLSHNSYTRFNVNNLGLILNNTDQTVVNTQLGGHILGNSNLTTPARVILNEVTSTNPSILNGFTEVAGQRADVVIANPNGISINGAGFINSSRVTLTTGVPTIDAHGSLGGFDVRGGEITIGGSGLNTQLQDSTSIYTHFLNLNAKLHAKDVDIALGKNQIDYPGRKIVSSSKGSINRVLLDSSALGGMYANKIVLVGTDQGLGMKLPPEVIASSGDIQISNDGRLVLQKLDAGGNIALQSNDDIESTDTVYSAGNVDIDARGDVIVQSGMIAAKNQIAIDSDRVINDGSIMAGLEFDGGLNSWGDLRIEALDVDNRGEITSTNLLSASAGTITNRGLLNAFNQLDLDADTLVNEATLFSGGNTRLHVNDYLHNTVDAAIFTINNLELAADSNSNKTSQITNELGLIQSLQGDINIFATRFDNLGVADIQHQMIYYDLGNGREVDRPGDAMTLNLAYSTGYTKHRSKARSRWVNKVLDRLARQAPQLYQDNASNIRNNRSANFLAIESRLIDNSTTTPAYLDSGNDLNLHVDSFNNQDAITVAARDIQFDIALSYLNQASFASEAVTDYRYYTSAKHKRNWKSDDKYSSIGRSGYAPITRTRKVTSNTITQAGRNIKGNIGGQAVNSGVLLGGQYQSPRGVTPADYSVSGITIPSSDFGLFVKSTGPDSQYLIETNPRFTNFGIFVNSSYLLDRLDFAPSVTLKRLGDAFYESKLIRDSVFAQSGRRYLNVSIQNDNQQFQYLMDNALVAQQALQLSPGVALNNDQINRLTRDIVWLEETQIEGQTVLVPTVYLANGPKAVVRGGKILAGGDTRLQVAALANSGLIESAGDLEIDADDDIENRGAMKAGDALNLSVTRDIENISGRIEARDIEITSVDGNIINRRNTEDYAYSARELSLTTTLSDEAAVIQAENGLTLDAAGEILVEGSVVRGDQVNLSASTVEIKTTVKDEGFFSGDNKNHVKDSSTTHFASTVNGKDIVILSSGKTRVSGSTLNAEKELRVLTGDLEIKAVNDSEYFASLETNKDTFSKTVSSKQDPGYRAWRYRVNGLRDQCGFPPGDEQCR
jgi:filamentous hemagglutinin family protein